MEGDLAHRLEEALHRLFEACHRRAGRLFLVIRHWQNVQPLDRRLEEAIVYGDSNPPHEGVADGTKELAQDPEPDQHEDAADEDGHLEPPRQLIEEALEEQGFDRDRGGREERSRERARETASVRAYEAGRAAQELSSGSHRSGAPTQPGSGYSCRAAELFAAQRKGRCARMSRLSSGASGPEQRARSRVAGSRR